MTGYRLRPSHARAYVRVIFVPLALRCLARRGEWRAYRGADKTVGEPRNRQLSPPIIWYDTPTVTYLAGYHTKTCAQNKHNRRISLPASPICAVAAGAFPGHGTPCASAALEDSSMIVCWRHRNKNVTCRSVSMSSMSTRLTSILWKVFLYLGWRNEMVCQPGRAVHMGARMSLDRHLFTWQQTNTPHRSVLWWTARHCDDKNPPPHTHTQRWSFSVKWGCRCNPNFPEI